MWNVPNRDVLYTKGCVDLDYLCNFGDPLNHEPVSCHSCVDRKWNSKHGTHHHLLDQLLTCKKKLKIGSKDTVTIQMPHKFWRMYAHTCKIRITPVSNRTYLNILTWWSHLEKMTHPAHTPTWAQLRVAELRRSWRPAKNILDRIIRVCSYYGKYISCLLMSSGIK